MLSLIFRASFAGLCFAAFAVYVSGVQVHQIAELLLFLILVVVVMIIPAALFVGFMKLMAYLARQLKHHKKE